MAFVACGLNHKTAPIDLRERFALHSAANNTLLNRLNALTAVHEVVVLSTCNRTEIYCETDAPTEVLQHLASEVQCTVDELSPFIYFYQDSEAIRHLLRVASGLDSMMLGEPQILGQLKQAYQSACEQQTVKTNLHQVFQFIFNAVKRVRTHSGIGKNPISIAYAAVQLIVQRFKNLDSLNVFIIGSGETAALVAKYLYQKGVQQFMIANRTHEKAQLLATQFNAQALSITDIPHYLPKADVVISATSCPLPFINKHLVERALADRDNALMFFLDLAVPRDIETEVAELEAVRLYNIDDLHTIVGEGMEERRVAAAVAEQLVENEMADYVIERREAKAKDIITDYRSQMKLLASEELQRAQQQLTAGKCQYSVLSELSDRLVNKLTHLPTLGLRQLAADERMDFLDLVQYLFNKPTEHGSS